MSDIANTLLFLDIVLLLRNPFGAYEKRAKYFYLTLFISAFLGTGIYFFIGSKIPTKEYASELLYQLSL